MRRRAAALELRRDQPSVAITPDAGRQQAAFRRIAATQPDAPDLRQGGFAVADFRCLPDAIDASFVDEFFLGLRKPAVLALLAKLHPAAQRAVQPCHGIEHGMGGQIGQPFQASLALHAHGDGLQLLLPDKLAGRLVFGLLAVQQAVPQEAQ